MKSTIISAGRDLPPWKRRRRSACLVARREVQSSSYVCGSSSRSPVVDFSRRLASCSACNIHRRSVPVAQPIFSATADCRLGILASTLCSIFSTTAHSHTSGRLLLGSIQNILPACGIESSRGSVRSCLHTSRGDQPHLMRRNAVGQFPLVRITVRATTRKTIQNILHLRRAT
jgi:hypothetical protein